jgi:hypothetical protein
MPSGFWRENSDASSDLARDRDNRPPDRLRPPLETLGSPNTMNETADAVRQHRLRDMKPWTRSTSGNVSQMFPGQLHWGVLNGNVASPVLYKPLICYDSLRLSPTASSWGTGLKNRRFCTSYASEMQQHSERRLQNTQGS